MKDFSVSEATVIVLRNYLPGTDAQIAEKAVKLLEQVSDEKTLVYLRNKHRLQGGKTTHKHIHDMSDYAAHLRELEKEGKTKTMVDKLKVKKTRGKNGNQESKGQKLQEESTKEHGGGSEGVVERINPSGITLTTR